MFKVVLLSCLIVVPAIGGTSKALTQENPMRKIISMLQDMAKEVEREGAIETELFEKALCACANGEGELDKVIADSGAAIEEWTAKTASGNAEKTQLTQEVADHKKNAAQATDDLSEATTLREKEQAAFSAEEADTKSNLDGLSKAIPAIEKGMGGASLMQLPGMSKKMDRFRRYVTVTKIIDNDDRSRVLAFLDSGADSDDAQTSQTQGAGEILGILKNMKDEMEKDLKDLQDQETKDHEGFNDLKAAKMEEIDINKKSVISKEKRIGELMVELSEGNHALEDAKEELANAQKFKANMAEECASKAKEKAAREKARAEEVKAISEAVGILNDDDALETFSKAKGAALVQQPRVTYDALLQLTHQRVVSTHAHKHAHVLLLSLKERTRRSKEEPSTGDSAEKLVVHMVDGMVGVMHDEDVGDEHKKAWCNNETEVSHNIEANKKTFIEQTTQLVSEQEDELATLTSEIKGLTEKIQALDKLVHETTTQRKEEHQEFVDMFATSATAIRLVGKAITRLEKFYSPEKFAKAQKAAKDAALAKAGLALNQEKKTERANQLQVQKKMSFLMAGADFDALIQEDSSRATLHSMSRIRQQVRNGVDPVSLPETPKGGHEKQESGGVIALMNEFVTDLKMEMTESETSEKFNSKEYVRIMSDAQATRASDVKSMNDKKAAKATLEEKHVADKEALALTEEELHNLQLYLVQVHTECDFLIANYHTRHASRVDEETGLEEAETIVTDAEPPSHRAIEKRFAEEHTDDDVDEHFPGTPIDDGPDKGLR
jgi:septal ring factor EnvC (AmiA/AmiB activator)